MDILKKLFGPPSPEEPDPTPDDLIVREDAPAFFEPDEPEKLPEYQGGEVSRLNPSGVTIPNPAQEHFNKHPNPVPEKKIQAGLIRGDGLPHKW